HRDAGRAHRADRRQHAVRGSGGLLGVAIDPLTAHECGNSRYLAIPWLDKCLSLRLPTKSGQLLRQINLEDVWLAEPTSLTAQPSQQNKGDPLKAGWLPGKEIATAWMQFRKDTNVADSTPPPAPSRVKVEGNKVNWTAAADLESGIEKFRILRDGKFLADVNGAGKNRYGRQLFQNLQYSDTPTQPLVTMEFIDKTAKSGVARSASVITVNTAGLESKPTPATRSKEQTTRCSSPLLVAASLVGCGHGHKSVGMGSRIADSNPNCRLLATHNVLRIRAHIVPEMNSNSIDFYYGPTLK
ncbi:MAG: hypothetical protein AAF394_11035, partial [Planctomycetota bacterium]